MSEFHFLRPYWLLLFLPVLVVCFGLWRQQQSSVRWQKSFDPHLLEHLLAGQEQEQRIRPLYPLFIIWLLTVLALAGPSWNRIPSPFADEQGGLVVLLKVSESMLSGVLQPSRLERAKQKLHDLLQLRDGAATGLIVYSGSSHLVMPLTKDNRIIDKMVAGLSPEVMPVDGDVLPQALLQAGELLSNAGVPGSILVLADTVSAASFSSSEMPSELPIQFLAMRSLSQPVDQGMQDVAAQLRANIVKLTVDQQDVEQIVADARSEFVAVDGGDNKERWQDQGYAILPVIVFLALFWSRKGWVVR